jgi:glucosamine--fructose-6-phosphate aminotransferase (isomerizing)
VLWCLERFRRVVAVTNFPASPLARAKQTQRVVALHAGNEQSAATISYINTLITLLGGLGFKPQRAVAHLIRHFPHYQKNGISLGQKVFRYLKNHRTNGLYILGSGPNVGTAKEAALALSETTKLAWLGMSVAEFDHGPKETADNSVIVFLISRGRKEARARALATSLQRRTNALVLRIEERALPESLSPLTLIAQAYTLMDALAARLRVKQTYRLGGKVTLTAPRFR